MYDTAGGLNQCPILDSANVRQVARHTRVCTAAPPSRHLLPRHTVHSAHAGSAVLIATMEHICDWRDGVEYSVGVLVLVCIPQPGISHSKPKAEP